MKKILPTFRRGFTLVELLVVMAIIGIVMTMSAGVLRDVGKGKGVEAGVDLLERKVQEARATAQGNDTYTRVLIASDPKDTSKDSRHLRYVMVQIYERKSGKNSYDGTEVAQAGTWKAVSAGEMLPPDVYFSPYYSTPLEWAEGGEGAMIGQDNARLSNKGITRVYYIEFDEKGRFVAPDGDPLTPTRPQRLVVIPGRRGTGKKAHDGIIPRELDTHRRPVGAKGVVIWPSGDVSLLRTVEQAIDVMKK